MATTTYVREDRLQRVRFVPSPSERRLRALTVVGGGLLVVQAIAVAALSDGSSLTVTATSLDGPVGSLPDLRPVAEVPLGPAVAGLLGVSGGLHLLVAHGRAFEGYVRDLRRGRNRMRRTEHALSASLVVALVALLVGITDVAALIALLGLVTAAASLVPRGQQHPGTDPATWWPAVAGAVPGTVAWLTMGAYLWWPGARAEPAAFVGRLYVSLLVLYIAIAVNQWFQYARVGPWRRCETGEVAHVVLGVTAKSALAWQVVVSAFIG